ncbi:MAG: hypothetical protein ACREEE_16175 [Dongiaceae bacterium]
MNKSDPHGTSKIIGHVMEWSRRPEWSELFQETLEEHVGEAMEDFGIESLDELSRRIGPELFYRHCYGCVFEDFLGCANDRDETIVDEYLRRRGFKEPGLAKRYLRNLGESSVSLYEVIESVPDSHMILRDRLRGGEPFRVEERAGSRQLVKWDLLAVRVVSHNNNLVLSGGMQRFEPETAEALAGELREIAETRTDELVAAIAETDLAAEEAGIASLDDPDEVLQIPSEEEADEFMAEVERDFAARGLPMPDFNNLDESTPELVGSLSLNLALAESAPMFTYYWLTQTLRQLNAPPPKLVNTDGEDIAFIETRWPIIGKTAGLARALKRVESDSLVRMETDEPVWGWLSAPKPDALVVSAAEGLEAAPPGRVITMQSARVDDPLNRISLGTIELNDDTLILSVNSEDRAARGRAMIEDWLPGMLGSPTVVRKELGDLREEPGLETEPLAPQDEIPRDLQSEIMNEMLNRHYRTWIDTPLPILDGRTPRQVAKSGKASNTLAQLLKSVENTEARRARDSGDAPHDFAWLWRELGVTPDDR